MKQGFDNEKYLKIQSAHIKERIAQFGDKLYLEFGGKLFDDFHASRVLPGFEPDSKLKMLMQLKEDAEIVIVISARDIEKNKVRGDLGITYDVDVLRLRDEFMKRGLMVSSVVITHYNGQSSASAYRERLERLGINVYYHYIIEGYPTNVDLICSDEGFGKNEYVKTSRPLVVITAPGPGSGKMAVCLSQLYQENKRGVKAGYAKFETFPIWNLPLKHPVNLAYEAATVNLNDVNMIDNYYYDTYGEVAVNYNRDIEIFPVLRSIFKMINGGVCPYNSPTEMGVNMAGYCIDDDEAVCRAANDEIIRRYFETLCDCLNGKLTQKALDKMELLMKVADLTPNDRPVVQAALDRSIEENRTPAVAIELKDGQIVTGKTSAFLGPASAALLNAVKKMGGLKREDKLISRSKIEPIQKLKVDILGNTNPRLHSDEALIALAVSVSENPELAPIMENLSQLRGCEAHSTIILSQVDADVYRKLGINLTCEPRYHTKALFHK